MTNLNIEMKDNIKDAIWGNHATLKEIDKWKKIYPREVDVAYNEIQQYMNSNSCR